MDKLGKMVRITDLRSVWPNDWSKTKKTGNKKRIQVMGNSEPKYDTMHGAKLTETGNKVCLHGSCNTFTRIV